MDYTALSGRARERAPSCQPARPGAGLSRARRRDALRVKKLSIDQINSFY